MNELHIGVGKRAAGRTGVGTARKNPVWHVIRWEVLMLGLLEAECGRICGAEDGVLPEEIPAAQRVCRTCARLALPDVVRTETAELAA